MSSGPHRFGMTQDQLVERGVGPAFEADFGEVAGAGGACRLMKASWTRWRP